MKRLAPEWYAVLVQCQVKPAVAAEWASVFADVIGVNTFSRGDDELDDFLGQVLHESWGLTHLVEDLNYSAQRLCQVWPHRFATLESARPFERNPEALANAVYGGRMGNTQPGDGWKFRARSPIGITGHNNYLIVGDLIGQDLTVMPELLEQPHYALEATVAWWEDRIPDSMIGDPLKVTRRVNGGLIGLADRERLTDLAGKALA
ncbi:glycoside hydrolase family 19 protein [Aquabacterium sp.]|uniref:glycoside hydrolase family 19 protein n=1 Tax=Aquabacterium sp. TaxID=1872578 RepID=UPI0025C70760|nr:glycoside hydrolase family 19 protein [Aquabacterium sp.]